MTSPTVFMVDDDDAARDSLAMLLQLKGYSARTFANAEEFLENYRLEWPGCLVLDLRMGGMSGIELQAELARRDVPTTRATLKAGAVDFIEKPIDHDALLAAIDAAFDRDARERARASARSGLDERLARLTARAMASTRKVHACT